MPKRLLAYTKIKKHGFLKAIYILPIWKLTTCILCLFSLYMNKLKIITLDILNKCFSKGHEVYFPLPFCKIK